jgi:metal-sulfur cluster biosynthetic enzyme
MLEIEITDEYYEGKTAALNALYQVTDPELGINIVDMGLVYSIIVNEKKVLMSMTLSTPSCPMGNFITAHAKMAIESALPDYEIQVELVWEPRWNAELISEEGKAALGW